MVKERKFAYRRNLPHIQKADRAHYATFVTHQRWELPPMARDLVLKHCLHDNGSKIRLFITVVMPDHVHMIFLPLRVGNTETYSFEEILGAIKGASAHSVNKALQRSGTVWQDESFDHVLRCAEDVNAKVEYVRQNPVRKGLVSRPEDYKWLWQEPQPGFEKRVAQAPSPVSGPEDRVSGKTQEQKPQPCGTGALAGVPPVDQSIPETQPGAAVLHEPSEKKE